MKQASKLTVVGVTNESHKPHVSAMAWEHVNVAASTKIGACAETRDGHVVRRRSASEWEVVEAPDGDKRYEAGCTVLARVLFWRMDGLVSRVAAVETLHTDKLAA